MYKKIGVLFCLGLLSCKARTHNEFSATEAAVDAALSARVKWEQAWPLNWQLPQNSTQAKLQPYYLETSDNLTCTLSQMLTNGIIKFPSSFKASRNSFPLSALRRHYSGTLYYAVRHSAYLSEASLPTRDVESDPIIAVYNCGKIESSFAETQPTYNSYLFLKDLEKGNEDDKKSSQMIFNARLIQDNNFLIADVGQKAISETPSAWEVPKRAVVGGALAVPVFRLLRKAPAFASSAHTMANWAIVNFDQFLVLMGGWMTIDMTISFESKQTVPFKGTAAVGSFAYNAAKATWQYVSESYSSLTGQKWVEDAQRRDKIFNELSKTNSQLSKALSQDINNLIRISKDKSAKGSAEANKTLDIFSNDMRTYFKLNDVNLQADKNAPVFYILLNRIENRILLPEIL